ncbi:unnamed protein product [Ectocarpus sp. 8 AP-2014]
MFLALSRRDASDVWCDPWLVSVFENRCADRRAFVKHFWHLRFTAFLFAQYAGEWVAIQQYLQEEPSVPENTGVNAGPLRLRNFSSISS